MPADAHDVASMRFSVMEPGTACDSGAVVAEATVDLEDEALPENLDPHGGAGDAHAFADGFFVVPAGDYTICAQPLQADGSPSAVCSLAYGSTTVFAEVTTEVILMSQCGGDPNGAVDIVGALNDSPLIDDLDILPTKFVTTCQQVEVRVSAAGKRIILDPILRTE